MNILVGLFLVAAAAGSSRATELCTVKALGLSISPDSEVVASADRVTASIAVEFFETTSRLSVRFTSAGALAHRTRDVELEGPWAAGDTIPLHLAVSAVGEGSGEVSVRIASLDEQGRELRMRRAILFGLVERGRVWLSGSSPTDLKIRRADRERAEGLLTAEAHAAVMDRIVGTRVAEDHVPRPVAERTAADLEIERVLGFTPQVSTAGIRDTAGATSLTVKGHAEWTDRNGGKHGIPMATVEIYDEDLLSTALITTVTTNAAGDYTASFSYDDGPLQGDPDIFVKVYARSPVADIKPPAVGALTYFLQSPTTNEVPNGTTLTVNFTAGNVNDGETVFSLHHALVVIGTYAGTLAGVTPSQVDTRYPTTQSTSCFINPTLHILQLDRWDWDVDHHEYGHYFMAIQNIQNNPGGNHSFASNLATTAGSKDAGIRLAWGEGWPTYFGTSGQAVMGSAALGVPTVGDTRYTDTEDSTNDVDLETSTGVGEDNELSVMAALWDLYDTPQDGEDKVAMGDKALFNAIKGASAKTMGAAWEAVAATFDTRGKTKVGAVLGQANIAPVLLMPADGAMLKASDPPTQFKWKKNGGGTPNPLNDFRIRFYKADFSEIAFEKELGNVDTFTPTGPEWTSIFSKRTPIRWVVEGKNTSAPSTPGGALDHYWSGARTIGGVTLAFVIDDTGSMGEEIGSVVAAVQAFIDVVAAGLPPGAEAPTLQVITFKDFVQDRIISNDLNAVKAVVAGLTASGGGDCPEFSAHGVEYAANTISPGGTIVLATDAAPQPGVDMFSVSIAMLAKGVTFNTILSGDCDPIATRPQSAWDMPDRLLDSGPQGDTVVTSGSTFVTVPPATGSGPALLKLAVRAPSGSAGASSLVRKQGTNTAPTPVIGKPGDNDPPQPPVVDAGQAPPDDHGDTFGAATSIGTNAPPVRGVIGANGDLQDWFVMELPASEAGRISTVRVWEETSFNFLTLGFFDSDGTTFLGNNFATDNTKPADTQITVTGTGFATLYLRVSRSAGTGTPYKVSVLDDTLTQLTDAVTLYSAVSGLTKGAFLVRDDVNLPGKTAKYQASLFNLLMSTIQPTVLASNPDSLPQSTTLAVSLQGRNTNFRSNSTVGFSGAGITVNSVNVHSATSLTANVTLAPGAALGLRDATVTTQLAVGNTEIATGKNVVEVIAQIVVPAILSVEPATLSQGKTTHVIVRGVNTAWDNTSTLSLGAGLAITGLSAISQQKGASAVRPSSVTSATTLEADVTPDSDATIGFRTATVTTGPSTQSRGRSVFVEIGGVDVPLLATLIPSQAPRSLTVNVAVTGTGTHFVNGVTTADFGTGIAVSSLTVTDSTHATAHIQIDPAAAVGYRDVVLTTGSESAVLLNGFFVSDLVKGDANGDGIVNGLDIVALINFLFASGLPPVAPCDVNLDGNVNANDVVYLINYVFANGPAPL